MQNSRHRAGDLDEIFPQTGGGKPNCPALGHCPVENAATPPRNNGSITVDIDANFSIGLRTFPRNDAVNVAPKLCGQAGPTSVS
jgi:hypothetical protein